MLNPSTVHCTALYQQIIIITTSFFQRFFPYSPLSTFQMSNNLFHNIYGYILFFVKTNIYFNSSECTAKSDTTMKVKRTMIFVFLSVPLVKWWKNNIEKNIEKKIEFFFQFFFKQLLFKAATSIASCLLGILKRTLKMQ